MGSTEKGRALIVNCSSLGFTSEKLPFFVKEVLVSMVCFRFVAFIQVLEKERYDGSGKILFLSPRWNQLMDMVR